MSQDARVDEETNTQRRARILGMNYVDTSRLSSRPLFEGVLEVEEIRSKRTVPLNMDKSNILFGITTTTSQLTMKELQTSHQDQRVTFAIISDTGFKEYMELYDPPKKIIYQDIDIKTAGTDELLAQVSATLEQVRADDILAYLVQQAHRLNASDIHIETGTEDVRIRIRIDGVLASYRRA